jgi:alkylation response protein AidB-like acyl-CoA dehydrogenase
MDLDYPADIEEFRSEVRAILDEELPADWRGIGAIPTEAETAAFVKQWRQTLYRRGLFGVAWPAEFGGRGLSKLHQVVLVEELVRRGVPFGKLPQDATGFKMLGNILLLFGTQAQKEEFLPGLLSGELRYCQGFSEPSAGSDLASVRTKAVLRDGQWHIDGQKIWTSGAHEANGIFVLARTDPDAPKHRGLTFLLVPFDQPGVEVRTIRHFAGGTEFCEVFFTDAVCREDLVVGEVNGGWKITRALLEFERGEEAATNPLLFRAEYDRLVELARHTGAITDSAVRQRLGRLYARVEVMRYIGYRILTEVLEGKGLSSAASVSKLYWSEYHQEVTSLALDLEGIEGTILHGKGPSRPMRTDDPGADPLSTEGWWQVMLNSRTGTIYAGTTEVQRSILGEALLGLPRDAQPA